jgi:PAS domain S-box-containing protein
MDIEDQRITYISPSVKKIRGYTPEEVMAQSLDEMLTPESLHKVLNVLADELAGDREIDPDKPITMELEQYRKDGSTVWTEIMASYIWDDSNRPTAVLGVARDITERIQTQAVLRESEERTARSKKMEALGLLAGGVAHDLNNVLSGIISYPELILMDLPENSKLRKPIETIQESGNRAAAIVQDLLTVARGVAISKEPLNLNHLIEIYLHSPEADKLKQVYPAVKIKTHLDEDIFFILGSDVHVRKIVMNLVANAVEAIQGDGQKILVVDDVASQRKIACMMLERIGYQATSVASGAEALNYLDNKRADLLLLDMIMDPGMNGLETYERIIRHHPSQKAIIVSGFAVTKDVMAVQKLGAGVYLKKPYNIEKLGLAVQEELNKKR